MVNNIRNGQKVWPTCSECGCRLKIITPNKGIWEGALFLNHFEGVDNRDARGCICADIDTYYIYKDGKFSVHFMY